jgi:hypothetical protein
MWGVGGTRREVDEERLAGRQRFLLADPGYGPVGQVLGQVIALVRACGGSTGVVPSYRAGYHWLVLPPIKPSD